MLSKTLVLKRRQQRILISGEGKWNWKCKAMELKERKKYTEIQADGPHEARWGDRHKLWYKSDLSMGA